LIVIDQLSLPGFRMTENWWRAIILTLSCAVVIITVCCLSAGITIIFMHLYYIPIVLLAYHYRKKGFFLSVLLSLLYFAFVVAYEPSDLDTIEGAGIRAILFIAVAALVVYLSEYLVQARESLGKTTQIQQSILQNANVWLMVLDSRGKILLWNKAAEEISGYNANEVIGKNEVWKFLYPEKDYRKEITDKITEIIRKNNYLENLRTTIVCKNGTHKIILWNTRGIPGEADKSSQFIAIGLDITDRTRAEEALKRSEEKYRLFFNTSRDCVFITSPDGCWIDLNDAAVEFFGYESREELQKVKVSDLYEDPSERDRHLRYIDERGYSIEYPVNLRKKDGTIINTLITSVAIKDDKGKIVSYQGTIRDVTERKRMEESLKKSQLQLTEAMDLADLVNWEFDVPTGVFTFNDRFYAMYGTTAEREGGYEMPAEVYAREFVHPDEINVVADEVNKAITTTDPDYVSQVEHRIIRRDGEIRHIIVRIAITKDANGRTIKTHGANQDITELKNIEEKLKRFNEELERQVKSRTEELKATIDEKILLLREIHHRVKNNLQIIISLVNLQMRQIGDERLKQVMAETQNRVRAMSLVHEKLYQSESLSHIDLSEYIRFLTTQLFAYYGIDSRRIRLDIDIGKTMVDINTAIPVGLIINELVSNALKHAFPSDQKGTITIRSRYDDKVLSLVVRDDGIGLPPDLDWKNPESLGLRLVNSLVDQLDGTIELKKERGTTFIISMHREIG
jgi:PAS domain S-box-containing protein